MLKINEGIKDGATITPQNFPHLFNSEQDKLKAIKEMLNE